MWRALLWTARIAVIVIFCLAIWVVSKMPKADDRQATRRIRDQYTVAVTNMIGNRQLRIACSPTLGGTRLFVYGDLSTNDEQVLKTLAVQISQSNSNRPISVEFREEIQPGTNN